MATQILKSIKGRRIRLTRLDACGVPVVGACSSIVTQGFVSVTITGEYEAGDQYLQKNAWGDLEINEVDPDTLKWVNVAIVATEINPDVMDIVAAGNPVTNGTDTIGATFGPETQTNAFALEVWTKQVGGDCEGGSAKWGYMPVPYIKTGKIDGSVTIENGVLNLSYMGRGFPAPADWGVGPYGDNPLLAVGGFPTGDIYGAVVTTVQPPELTVGCVALA